MMMVRTLSLLIILLAGLNSLSAQEMSWRKHRSLADDLVKQGNYYEAAENYRMAWDQRQNKDELIYLAAENYYRVSDYRKAADAYQHLQGKTGDYPLVGLKYARSLKQDGQYEKARTAFSRALDTYQGQDRAILQDIVRTEMAGIDLANTLAASTDRRLEILHPGTGVNTEADEFGAVPVNDNTIYFTSTMGGQARIYESQRQGRNWTKGANPSNFPVVQGGQYGNGAMSPDGQRFYFSICNNQGGWQDLNTRCEIYVIKRNANAWTQPERLPDFINAKGVNTTHPAVAHIAGQEYLYFSSNRQGGRGGMDIWYAARDLGLDNNDFTFPINLGPTVNTLGDEITPFYSTEEGALYFSSNGLITIGGQDIFKSVGAEVNWGTPQNIGFPLNSSTNDYGFIRSRTGVGGFFTSNRAFGGEKNNTRHLDIFEYSIGGQQMTLKANVYEQSNGQLLNNVKVSLYQIFDDGTENLLISKDFTGGSYLFELLPNRRFRVEVERPGYLPGGYVFSTNDPNTITYGQPLFLEVDPLYRPDANPFPGPGPVTTTPKPENPGTIYPPTNPPTTTPTYPTNPANPNTNPTRPTTTPTTPTTSPGDRYTARASAAEDNLEYISSAPRYRGTYFKIQLSAVRTFNPSHPDFQAVSRLGQVQTEEIPSRNLTRVLLADFFSEADAKNALQQVQSMAFPRAYIVRYDDGVRYGKVNL